jgi:formylglycine-generating enzyme required for sulfatase activity
MGKLGMVEIPAGKAVLGSDPKYAEEGPEREVSLPAFWMDKTDVTNAQFQAFVAATGYQTVAERRKPPSSLVFSPSASGVDLGNPSLWWKVVEGATWKTPWGAGSSIKGRETLPVVHVAFEDGLAYARWLGRDLPTEDEWEYAARGGLVKAKYVWGNEAPGEGPPRANTWQGVFPIQDSGKDGYRSQPSPVACFPANAYGLFDMAGNVWQWTRDEYLQKPNAPVELEKGVIKGGSFLCAESYCMRYRPSARVGAERQEGSSHLGFRTIIRTIGDTKK